MRTLPLFIGAPTFPHMRPSVEPTPPAADRVTAAFRAAFDDSDRTAGDELRASTFAFVMTLKSEGLPPERVLVSLKRALTRDGRWVSLAPECCRNHGAETPEHRIYGRVFDWYLDAYYGRVEFSLHPS